MGVCSRGAFGEMLDFEESFCDKAAECGHRSFVIMAGALDGQDVEARVFSHEDVTGVGYGICSFRPAGENPERRFLEKYRAAQAERLAQRRADEDPYVRLARENPERIAVIDGDRSIEAVEADTRRALVAALAGKQED